MRSRAQFVTPTSLVSQFGRLVVRFRPDEGSRCQTCHIRELAQHSSPAILDKPLWKFCLGWCDVSNFVNLLRASAYIFHLAEKRMSPQPLKAYQVWSLVEERGKMIQHVCHEDLRLLWRRWQRRAVLRFWPSWDGVSIVQSCVYSLLYPRFWYWQFARAIWNRVSSSDITLGYCLVVLILSGKRTCEGVSGVSM